MKKGILAILLTLALTAFIGCSNKKVEAPAADEETAEHEMMGDMDEMDMIEMPGELSEEESVKYTGDLPLARRIELGGELSMKMPRNGMKQMKAMFPDLKKVADVGDKDPRNMMMMGAEALYYSEEADVTISVCVMADSPLHLFIGSDPSQAEFDEAIEMMHEMMGDMGDMEMMDKEKDAPADLQGAGVFTEYSEAKFAKLKGTTPVTLFFHADWCPTCITIENELNKNLGNLPEGTTILMANFDTESKLKKEYGITVQSILVFLDSDGNEIKRLSAPSFDQIKTALIESKQ